MKQGKNMAGDWHDNFLWGTAATLFAGIYGLMANHLWSHMRKKDMEDATTALQEHRKEYLNLTKIVQYRDNCTEIVRRQDEANRQNHETNKRTQELVQAVDAKVDRLIEKLM